MSMTQWQSALIRGDACHACRVRKVKCDGSRPICVRCSHMKRECLYTGLAPRPRPTETLELRALQLERQIADMLNMHSKVLLSHRVFEQFRVFGNIPRKHQPPLHPRIFIHPYSLPSAPPITGLEGSGSPDTAALAPGTFVCRSLIAELFEGWRPELGTSMEQTLYLVRLFLPRRTYSNFFCKPEELLARSILPPTDPHALHPALLNAMSLIVCSIFTDILGQYVPYFVEETQKQLQVSLAFADRITQFLWASIIYGLWLARAGRFIECYVSISSTSRFALGCGLAGGKPEDCILLPPQTVDEAVDRIHLIHALYQSDRSLSMYSALGGVLKKRDEYSESPTSPNALFHKALHFPLDVWPDVLSLEDAAAHLDHVLLLRTAVSLLQERVEMLTSSIFIPSSSGDLETDGLYGNQLEEFQNIASDLDTLKPLLTPYPSTLNGILSSDINPTVFLLHGSYHGTLIILYNIIVVLDTLGHQPNGVGVEEARRRTLEASNTLASIALITAMQSQLPSRVPQAILFLHFTNAVLVYVRELKRSTIRTSARQIAAWCDSLSILMDVLQTTLIVIPTWAHLANPIRQLLPTSPTEIDLSTEQVDLNPSPVLRVSL